MFVNMVELTQVDAKFFTVQLFRFFFLSIYKAFKVNVYIPVLWLHSFLSSAKFYILQQLFLQFLSLLSQTVSICCLIQICKINLNKVPIYQKISETKRFFATSYTGRSQLHWVLLTF